jgi:hypothetical protein
MKRMEKRQFPAWAFGLFFALSVAAQAPKPTEVRGHFIGESVQEFFARSGWSTVIEDCRAAESDKKFAKKLAKEKGQVTCAGAAQALIGNDVILSDPAFPNVPRSFAVLSDRKLEFVLLYFDRPLADLLPDLRSKYGQEQSLTSKTLQNGFGTTFEVGTAAWGMPDETTIVADESIESDDFRGLFRSTKIIFASKEQKARADQLLKDKPNAFDKH